MKSTFLALALLAAMTVAAAEPSNPPDLDAQLRGIARKYLKSQLVNPAPLIAPGQCFIPPTEALYSQAKTGRAHGGKLFYLFAKQRAPLVNKQKFEQQPTGQYVVKETWESLVYDEAVLRKRVRHPSGRFLSDSAWDKGKRMVTGKPLDLYIMLKQDANTPDTDAGWTYAVLSRDGKTVHKAGRIQSCIDCHEDAKNDRILGDYPADPSPFIPSRKNTAKDGKGKP